MLLRSFGRNRVNALAGLVQKSQVRGILIVYHLHDAILVDVVGDGESSRTIGSFPNKHPVSAELATCYGLLHLLAFGLFRGPIGHALNRPHLFDKNIRRSFRLGCNHLPVIKETDHAIWRNRSDDNALHAFGSGTKKGSR